VLKLEVPPSTEPVQRITLDMPGHFEHEILSYEVQPGSLVAARDLTTLEVPHGSHVVAVMRDGVPQPLRPELKFEPRDFVHLLVQPQAVPALNRLFDPHQAPDRLEEHRYFGDFVLNGDALLGDLAAVYGIDVPKQHAAKTLADYLNERSHGRVVVGDRAPLGNALLVVRDLQDGRVSRVGLKIR
jgi:potassium/hydrogen antiporter